MELTGILRGVSTRHSANHVSSSRFQLTHKASIDKQRPAEGSNLRPLSFPIWRTILWDHRATGQPMRIHLSEYRNPTLILEEKTLWLLQRFAAQDPEREVYNCSLVGSASSEPDGEGIKICLDRMDPAPPCTSSEEIDGELHVPCSLQKKNNFTPVISTDHYSKSIRVLCSNVSFKHKIDLGKFLQLRAYCSYHPNNQNNIFHVDIDLVTVAKTFMVAPINAVPIMPTALSKNLSGPMSFSDLQGEPKTGYLTMDHSRKIVLVLESDPKLVKLPLVGIWLSGIHNIHDPFVWASCVRYLYNNTLQDRVCLPPECFLIVHFSPLNSGPDFYNCVTSDLKPDISCTLSTCHEIITLPKDSPVRPKSPLEIELSKVECGRQFELFEAALQESSQFMAQTAPGANKRAVSPNSAEDIVPRASPAPHFAKELTSLVRPTVPEVSILLDEKVQGNLSQNVYPNRQYPDNSMPQASTKQPPYPAIFKEKKGKKKKDSKRGPLKTLNGPPVESAGIPTSVGYSQSPAAWPCSSPYANPCIPTYPMHHDDPMFRPQYMTPAQYGNFYPFQSQEAGPGFIQGGMYPPRQTLYSSAPTSAHSQSHHVHMMHASHPLSPHMPSSLPHPNQYVPNNSTIPYPHQSTATPVVMHPGAPPPTMSGSMQQKSPIHDQSLPVPTSPQSHSNSVNHRSPPKPCSSPLGNETVKSPDGRPCGSAAINSSNPDQHPVSTNLGPLPNSVGHGNEFPGDPSQVYELLRSQDSQLKELRMQLEQLLLTKGTSESATNGPTAIPVEMMSTGTQSSVKNSPAKKNSHQCEMAVNTSFNLVQTPDSGITENGNQLQNDKNKNLREDSPQSRSNDGQSERGMYCTEGNRESQIDHSVYSQRRGPRPGQWSVDSRQRNEHFIASVKYPNAKGSMPSEIRPVQDKNERMNNSGNDSCSLSELQLQNFHDRTEDSYISMVVDMPGYNSLSPDKSVHGESSVYECAADNSRSPVLGESVSMYEQFENCHPVHHPINQSEDTGLGDSNPQVSLLYKNQHQFYNNLLGNVKKFLASKSTSDSLVLGLPEDENDNGNENFGQKANVVASAYTTPVTITEENDVSAFVDIAAQTREQIKNLGVDLEELESPPIQSRPDVSTYVWEPILLPKINYISMMLDSDSDMSADADALAMKYLSDEQLAELAKMRLKTPKTRRHHDSALDKLINKYHVEETIHIGQNNLSFASKKYMERYGLVDAPISSDTVPYEKSQGDESDRSHSKEMLTDPAILNVKASLKRLQENIVDWDDPNISSERQNKGMSHSALLRESNLSGKERQRCRPDSSRSGSGHGSSNFSSETAPFHLEARRDTSDSSASSTHGGFGATRGAVVTNGSQEMNSSTVKPDTVQRDNPLKSQPVSKGRILDIQRLKDLPKLL